MTSTSIWHYRTYFWGTSIIDERGERKKEKKIKSFPNLLISFSVFEKRYHVIYPNDLSFEGKLVSKQHSFMVAFA